MTSPPTATARKGDAVGRPQTSRSGSARTEPGGRSAARPAAPAKAASRKAGGPARGTGRRSPARVGRKPETTGRRAPERAAGRSAAGTVLAGVAWAAVLVATVAVGGAAAEVAVIPVAVVASVSGVRAAAGRPGRAHAGRGRGGIPLRVVVAAAGSVLGPLVALAGPAPAVGAAAVLALVTVAVSGPGPTGAAGRLPGRLGSLVVGAGPAVAAMSVVLARHQGSNYALAFLAAVFAYDAGAFLMGNARSATGGPVGVAFGLVSVLVVAVFVAAVMNPPFHGVRPWIVFSVVGVLSPVAVALCDRAVAATRLPALRRLDSLILAGPAWVVAVGLIAHR